LLPLTLPFPFFCSTDDALPGTQKKYETSVAATQEEKLQNAIIIHKLVVV